MERKYYLGIDGGGTKTEFIVIDEDNNIVYQNTIGASSFSTVPIEETRKNYLNEAKNIKYKVCSIYAGLGDITCEDDCEKINDILKQMSCLEEDGVVHTNSDVTNALVGALGGQDGIILIAGTGSVAFGKNKDRFFRSGGLCYQEGDVGSAYDLGHKALQHLARVIDGRRKRTDFANEIAKTIGCNDFSSLTKFFINTTRTETAKLAKIVTKYQNDEYAKRIIEEGTDGVVEMINAVYKKLNFDECLFSIIGTLGNADTLYRDLLIKKVKRISPKIKIINKVYEASFGSCLLAKMYTKNRG